MKTVGSITPTVISPRQETSANTPSGDKLVGFSSEPWVLVNGFPQVPRYWVNAKSSITLDGTSYDQNRPNPTDVDMGSHTRFIANAFDDFGGTWRPFYTEGADYFFRSAPGLAPHKNTVDYRIGKELFNVEALRFNPGDYLISSFNNGRDDAAQFTFALAMIPDAPTDYTVLSTQNSTSEISVHLSGSYKLTYGGQSSTLSLNLPATAMVPTYLILTSDGRSATLFIATSTKRIYSVTLNQSEAEISDLAFTIGKTRLGKATSTFNLIEANLYGYGVNRLTVPDIIGRLSGLYGAS